MKGAASNVLPLVIGVIISASLLYFGFKVIGSAGKGVKDIESTAKSEQQKIAGVQSLAKACDDWLNGEKYSADAILNVYKLPDRMAPFKRLKSSCGDQLKELATKCFGGGEGERGCAGGGYIDSGSSEIKTCTNVCLNAKRIDQKCKITCPEKEGICFENVVESLGSSMTRDTVSDSEIARTAERSC